MTPIEAVVLCRYVKACCPQQQIDEYTPDAWHDLLGDLALDDCKAAVVQVARRQPFVAPAEIREEVRQIRNDRLEAAPESPPPVDPNREADYRRALTEIRYAVAGGRMPFRAIEGGRARGAGPSKTWRETRSSEDADRTLAQTVPCPVEWCPARAGEPCRSGPLAAPMTGWHPSRLMAARTEAEAS
ncbi:hypothetical protein E1264_38095 [Actinomadura sp. KC216]|uniref:zinc finger domain-containing protein n=1 Tax=Actinomadura sp. KC216 TaxID=2530370 RepID=UPI00104C5074|nr:hypothetical protein [Actinomadura sp. KC216]TDB76802.1 hypothetical protein E1264_38095 [Actinomadura sp. KC216]